MKAIAIMSAMILSAGMVSAQNLKPYWVVETSVSKKDYTILRVYDSQDFLIHEETISGNAMNVLSKKDRKRINKKVKEVLSQEAMASGKKMK